ncbi:MAG: hypothetical protein JWN17_2200 [Frankiales bacterium]|nr:hypothetical protein [Frankiales bacterium]
MTLAPRRACPVCGRTTSARLRGGDGTVRLLAVHRVDGVLCAGSRAPTGTGLSTQPVTPEQRSGAESVSSSTTP